MNKLFISLVFLSVAFLGGAWSVTPDANDLRSIRFKAAVHFFCGDFESAVSEYREAIACYPNHVELQYGLAHRKGVSL